MHYWWWTGKKKKKKKHYCLAYQLPQHHCCQHWESYVPHIGLSASTGIVCTSISNSAHTQGDFCLPVKGFYLPLKGFCIPIKWVCLPLKGFCIPIKWKDSVHLWRDYVHRWRDSVYLFRDSVYLWSGSIYLWSHSVYLWRDSPCLLLIRFCLPKKWFCLPLPGLCLPLPELCLPLLGFRLLLKDFCLFHFYQASVLVYGSVSFNPQSYIRHHDALLCLCPVNSCQLTPPLPHTQNWHTVGQVVLTSMSLSKAWFSSCMFSISLLSRASTADGCKLPPSLSS